MTKLCSVCNAENREKAQFCRACGTAFVATTGHGSFGDEASAENVCSECGFRNKPGIRYCANCGMNLIAATAEAPLGDLAPAAEDPYAGFSPPPISYASFATVAPYPPPPEAPPPGYPPQLDDTTPLDIPFPDATIAIRRQEAQDDTRPAFMEASEAPPNRPTLVVAIVIGALIVAAIAAWLFLGRESSAPPASRAAPVAIPAPPAIASAAAPVAPVVTAPAPVVIDVPAAPAPAASAAQAESAPATPPAAAAPPIATPPAAAPPLPNVNDQAPVATPAEVEAKRAAADKLRREKAARDKAERDKAERDAKAKALADQREQAAAAARAEQEAQAKKRAAEAQRARPSPSAPAAAPASTQVRGVRESCAGRGTIGEAVCQSRLCSAAEHANDPLCRQLREADERRRNVLN